MKVELYVKNACIVKLFFVNYFQTVIEPLVPSSLIVTSSSIPQTTPDVSSNILITSQVPVGIANGTMSTSGSGTVVQHNAASLEQRSRDERRRQSASAAGHVAVTRGGAAAPSSLDASQGPMSDPAFVHRLMTQYGYNIPMLMDIIQKGSIDPKPFLIPPQAGSQNEAKSQTSGNANTIQTRFIDPAIHHNMLYGNNPSVNTPMLQARTTQQLSSTGAGHMATRLPLSSPPHLPQPPWGLNPNLNSLSKPDPLKNLNTISPQLQEQMRMSEQSVRRLISGPPPKMSAQVTPSKSATSHVTMPLPMTSQHESQPFRQQQQQQARGTSAAIQQAMTSPRGARLPKNVQRNVAAAPPGGSRLAPPAAASPASRFATPRTRPKVPKQFIEQYKGNCQALKEQQPAGASSQQVVLKAGSSLLETNPITVNLLQQPKHLDQVQARQQVSAAVEMNPTVAATQRAQAPVESLASMDVSLQLARSKFPPPVAASSRLAVPVVSSLATGSTAQHGVGQAAQQGVGQAAQHGVGQAAQHGVGQAAFMQNLLAPPRHAPPTAAAGSHVNTSQSLPISNYNFQQIFLNTVRAQAGAPSLGSTLLSPPMMPLPNHTPEMARVIRDFNNSLAQIHAGKAPPSGVPALPSAKVAEKTGADENTANVNKVQTDDAHDDVIAIHSSDEEPEMAPKQAESETKTADRAQIPHKKQILQRHNEATERCDVSERHQGSVSPDTTTNATALPTKPQLTSHGLTSSAQCVPSVAESNHSNTISESVPADQAKNDQLDLKSSKDQRECKPLKADDIDVKPSKDDLDFKPEPCDKLKSQTTDDLWRTLVNRKKILECVCGSNFNDKVMYLLHRGCHNTDEPRMCSSCGRMAHTWLDFAAHMYDHKK